MGKKVLILSGVREKAAIPTFYVMNLCAVQWNQGMKLKKSELPQKRLLRVLHAIIVKIVENVYIKMIWQKSCKK